VQEVLLARVGSEFVTETDEPVAEKRPDDREDEQESERDQHLIQEGKFEVRRVQRGAEDEEQ